MVEHVVFVIHGIGPNCTLPSIAKDMERDYRKIVKEDFKGSSLETRFVPIQWYDEFRKNNELMARLASIYTPSFASLKNLFLANMLEGVLYMNSYSSQLLIETVTKVINEAYEKFLHEYPNFTGKFSFFSHSLGGCICYDILAHQHSQKAKTPVSVPYPQEKPFFEIQIPRLKFSVENLFLVGSIAGSFMVARGLTPVSYRLPDGVRLYNIFDLYDPLVHKSN
jgi:hypothetical protein